jgi:hypothetical protein
LRKHRKSFAKENHDTFMREFEREERESKHELDPWQATRGGEGRGNGGGGLGFWNNILRENV